MRAKSSKQVTHATQHLDAESRVHEEHHESLRLWLRLLSCTLRIEAVIRQRLQAEFDTTLPRFDLMAQLERAPAGLRMSDLSRRMMVTGGNVTGIADSLERERLVTRDVDPTDRRVVRVKLTSEGQRQFRRMAVRHEEWIIDLLGPLSAPRKRQLAAALAELKSRRRAGTSQ